MEWNVRCVCVCVCVSASYICIKYAVLATAEWFGWKKKNSSGGYICVSIWIEFGVPCLVKINLVHSLIAQKVHLNANSNCTILKGVVFIIDTRNYVVERFYWNRWPPISIWSIHYDLISRKWMKSCSSAPATKAQFHRLQSNRIDVLFLCTQ